MKKILLILFLSLVACKKVIDTPIPPLPPNVKIFDVLENSIDNGQEIQFDLTKTGIYTLTIGDSVSNQVLTREKFNGKIGTNKKKIYTKSFSIKYLYLLLEDDNKNKIGKTKIIIK
jgi:hypothetical protein